MKKSKYLPSLCFAFSVCLFLSAQTSGANGSSGNEKKCNKAGSLRFQIRLEADKTTTSSTEKLVLDEYVIHNANHNGKKIPVFKEVLLDETDFIGAKILEKDSTGKVPEEFHFVQLTCNKKGKEKCMKITSLYNNSYTVRQPRFLFIFDNKIIARRDYFPIDPIYDGLVTFSTNLSRARPVVKYLNHNAQAADRISAR